MVHVETGKNTIAVFSYRARMLSKSPFIDKTNFCHLTSVLLAFRGLVGKPRRRTLTPEERMVNPD